MVPSETRAPAIAEAREAGIPLFQQLSFDPNYYVAPPNPFAAPVDPALPLF